MMTCTPAAPRHTVPWSTPKAGAGDAELVEAALAGERAAFARLYQAHAGAVATVVRASVGDRESVADLVQDVFAQALDRLASLRQPDRFRPWLLTIARRATIDHLRARSRRPWTVECEMISEPMSKDPGPEDMAELLELRSVVRGCVAGLSARDATALGLATRPGLSPADVARDLGVSAGAARVVVHRARHRLREAVAVELGLGPGVQRAASV